jgi:hypothetical protein
VAKSFAGCSRNTIVAVFATLDLLRSDSIRYSGTPVVLRSGPRACNRSSGRPRARYPGAVQSALPLRVSGQP